MGLLLLRVPVRTTLRTALAQAQRSQRTQQEVVTVKTVKRKRRTGEGRIEITPAGAYYWIGRREGWQTYADAET
jgi:hypothetical protein